MYYGQVFTLAIATQRGHADCGHEIAPGEIFALGGSCSSACLSCGVPTACDQLRSNGERVGLSRAKIARASLALRVFATSYVATPDVVVEAETPSAPVFDLPELG
jgi:hypothetical protein